MGRDARLKAERRAAGRSAAWQAGAPSIVTIPAETYARLRQTMQESLKVETAIVQIRAQATQARATAMQAAGLDPQRTYRLNDATLTAELVVA